MIKKITTEEHVKSLVKDWCDAHHAWHFAPVQNGLGVHGIHDRLICLPLVVTPAMVGKTIGLFVSVEAKRPGRRGELRRGMSKHQYDHMVDIAAAGGFSCCVDGAEDLQLLGAYLGNFADGMTDQIRYPMHQHSTQQQTK